MFARDATFSEWLIAQLTKTEVSARQDADTSDTERVEEVLAAC